MSWHKVTLPFKDCGVNGKGSQLRDAFGVILVANGGRPFDAAVFAQTSDDHESVYFYFSPAAVQLAPALVEQFHGVPCPGPPFVGKLVALEIGDARSWELLGVNKPAGMDAAKKPSTIVSVVCQHCGGKMKVKCDGTRAGDYSEEIACLHCKGTSLALLPGPFLEGPFLE